MDLNEHQTRFSLEWILKVYQFWKSEPRVAAGAS